jgi:hypothetical protein
MQKREIGHNNIPYVHRKFNPIHNTKTLPFDVLKFTNHRMKIRHQLTFLQQPRYSWRV